jgi:uncharacterized membrane protein YbaN (DUF454 family)
MYGISDKIKRIIYVFLGTLFLGMGLIGIVVPILPTTPFLLLSAACYVRGSKRIHNWMINHRVFGEYIRNYMEGKGISFRHKIFTLTFLWLAMIFSIFYMIEIFLVRILLVIVAIAVSVHIIRLPSTRVKD